MTAKLGSLPDVRLASSQGFDVYERGLKRALDLFIVGALAPLALALVLLGAVAVALVLGRPLFFRQKRIGWHGRPFELLKLRTMCPQSEGGNLMDHERTTAVTRFLRRASIDELPSLLNVIRGEMSLVGPRPLPLRYRQAMTVRERARESVRPGLTGLAQLSGRNSIGWSERLELDARYAQNVSFFGDVALLFRTIPAVLGGEGLEHDVQLRMEDLDRERAVE